MSGIALGRRFRATFSSLTIYNFRVFWIGQLISQCGTWMQTTAQAWLVLKLTNSPVALGTVIMLQFLPITVLILFGGVVADRLNKQVGLFCTQSIAAVQALILAALVISGTVQLWQVYGLALMYGVVIAFDNPMRQTFVSELVGADYLQNAVILNSSLINVARIVGPAIAGIVISSFGIGEAFLFNGLSFAPVLIGLGLMRSRDLYATSRSSQGNAFRQIGEGLRYAVQTPDVLAILLTIAVVGIFGFNYNTVMPLLARYVLHAGAFGLGILTSAVGLGSLAAAFIVASWRRISTNELLLAAVIFSVLLILVGTSTWLPLTLVLLGLMGSAGIILTAGSNTRLQLAAPSELRGRVLSIYFLLLAGTTPLGALFVGMFAARLGVQPAVVLMGGLCLAGVTVTGVFSWARGH